MRPADWSAVGFGGDPIPGDPVVVLRGGQDYLSVAEAISQTVTRLRSLGVDGQESEAIFALAETAGSVADDIAKAERRYRETGHALIDYSSALESAQSESLEALYAAHAAQQAAEHAASDQRRYLSLAQGETDPATAIRYSNLGDEASSDASYAHARVSIASERVHSAAAARDRAAERARGRIENTTSDDGLKDSWWDNWGKDVLSVVTDVAGTIAAVAGILALAVSWIPIIGQALAAALILVAGIAAIVNAIGNVVLASTGDRSWTEAIISIAGAALAVIGLGGAARIVGRVAATGIRVEAGALGRMAAAGRINAQATAEVASRGMGEGFERLTVRQALRLSADDLAESQRLWAKPVSELQPGDDIFRLYGGDSFATGASWSTSAPSSFGNARSALGLPDVNTAERLVIAHVDDVSSVVNTRHALPLNGMPGGAAEYIIPGSTFADKGISLIDDIAWSVTP